MHLDAKHPQLLFQDIGPEYFSQLLTACGSGEKGFRSRYLPVAEKLALTVQSLPLGKDIYSHEGGALRFGLVAGLIALRFCDAVMFAPQASAQHRIKLESDFRWAAWCATLACVPLMVYHQCSIMVDGEVWDNTHSSSSLFDAINTTNGMDVAWKEPTAELPKSSLAILHLHQFFYPGQFAQVSPTVVSALCDAINPAMVMAPGEHTLSRVVRTAMEKVLLVEKQRLSLIAVSGEAPPMDLTQDAGHVATEPARPAPIVPAKAPPKPKDIPRIPESIVNWANALMASDKANTVTFHDSGVVEVHKKGVDFGSTAALRLAELFAADLVDKKNSTGIICNAVLSQLFKDILSRTQHHA